MNSQNNQLQVSFGLIQFRNNTCCVDDFLTHKEFETLNQMNRIGFVA
jgi:hypothetical protein